MELLTLENDPIGFSEMLVNIYIFMQRNAKEVQ
jgi:hypothetical protein